MRCQLAMARHFASHGSIDRLAAVTQALSSTAALPSSPLGAPWTSRPSNTRAAITTSTPTRCATSAEVIALQQGPAVTITRSPRSPLAVCVH